MVHIVEQGNCLAILSNEEWDKFEKNEVNENHHLNEQSYGINSAEDYDEFQMKDSILIGKPIGFVYTK